MAIGLQAQAKIINWIDTLKNNRVQQRELKNLKEMVEASPCLNNKQKLAKAYIQAQAFDEAILLYKEMLAGDRYLMSVDLVLELSQLYYIAGKLVEAKTLLEQLFNQNREQRLPDAHLLYARVLEAQGEIKSALIEYESVNRYYPGLEATSRYVLLLRQTNKEEKAKEVYQSLVFKFAHAPKNLKAKEQQWMDLLTASQALTA